MSVEKIRMRLSIMQFENYKAILTLKSTKFDPFIAIVDDFDYSEDNTKVILKRCEETIFPNQTVDNIQDSFILYIKDIKEVNKYQ